MKAETLDEDEAASALTYRIIAPHIIKVVRADGAEDTRKFTTERVENLEYSLPDSEWIKLDQEVRRLSFETAFFDEAVDAGFLQKS